MSCSAVRRVAGLPITDARLAFRSLRAGGRGEHPVIPAACGRCIYVDGLPTAPARFKPAQGRSVERLHRDLPLRAIEVQGSALLHLRLRRRRAAPDEGDHGEERENTSVRHHHSAVLWRRPGPPVRGRRGDERGLKDLPRAVQDSSSRRVHGRSRAASSAATSMRSIGTAERRPRRTRASAESARSASASVSLLQLGFDRPA